MKEVAGGDDIHDQAAEYVIGTLGLEEREAFARRLRDDPSARRTVAEWEHRLEILAQVVDAVRPPPEVWTRIEHGLRLPGSKPLPFRVIEGGNRPTLVAAHDYRRSRDRWRATAVAGGAVAAALVAFIAVRDLSIRPASDVQGSYVAAVNRGGDKPALIVRVDLKTHQVLVRPVAAEAPVGHSLELWYVSDGKAPRSMGLVKAAPAVFAIPQGTTPGDKTTFAVSVEPEGGSKTGAPTGPVVYSGQLVPD